MSNSAPNTFFSQLRHAASVTLDLAAAFIDWLPQASLLRIAMLCLALAFFIAILPHALVLFVLFVVVKLIAIAFVAKPKQLTVDQARTHD